MQSDIHIDKQEKECLLTKDVPISEETKVNGFLCSRVRAAEQNTLLDSSIEDESLSCCDNEDEVVFHPSTSRLNKRAGDLQEDIGFKTSGHENENGHLPQDEGTRETDDYVCRKNDDYKDNKTSLENVSLPLLKQECEVSNESTIEIIDLGTPRQGEDNDKVSRTELVPLDSFDASEQLYSGLSDDHGVAETSLSEVPSIEDREDSPLLQLSNSNVTEYEDHGVAETSLLKVPSMEEGEDSRLLQLSSGSILAEEEQEKDDDDAESVVSIFCGSLTCDVAEIPWETDIDREVDLQIGEEGWETRINPMEGGIRVEGWDTQIQEISNEVDDVHPNIWNTSIHDIFEDEKVLGEWGTKIADQFLNEEGTWSTRINSIEKVDRSTNIWTTAFRKIRQHAPTTIEWRTSLNSIVSHKKRKVGKPSRVKPDWKFKMAKKMDNLSESTDWNTKINKLERSINTDIWEHKFSKMMLQCDDRQSQWTTKFLDISEASDELTPWETFFRDIAPSLEGEDDTWTSDFYKISDERDLPEHWETKFMDIGENENDENEWLIKMQDTPDNIRDPLDWSTDFNGIENHENNGLWDTLINGIAENKEEETPWISDFCKTDMTDIARANWETHFKDILRDGCDDLEWRIIVNPVEEA